MLIKCPDCNEKISDSNYKCPKCGYRFKERYNRIIRLVVMYVVIFAIIIGGIYFWYERQQKILRMQQQYDELQRDNKLQQEIQNHVVK